jgi:hypothetical protein
MILAIAGLLLLCYFLRALYNQMTFAKEVPIPWAPGWIPFLGHAIAFGKDADGTWTRARFSISIPCVLLEEVIFQ